MFAARNMLFAGGGVVAFPPLNLLFNFRDNVNYVLDAVGEIAVTSGSVAIYPQTGAVLYGWSVPMNYRDRTTTLGPKLAGMHFTRESGIFKADVPPGIYQIRIASGDPTAGNVAGGTLKDDAGNVLISIPYVSPGASNVVDASGTVRRTENWEATNTPIIVTSTGGLQWVITPSGGATCLAHLAIVRIA